MLESNKNLLTQLIDKHRDTSLYVLVDYSNLLIKQATKLNNLSVNLGGVIYPTGGVYGLCNFTERVLKTYPNAVIIYVLDSATGSDSRKQINPLYKSKRKPSEYKDVLFSFNDKVINMLSLTPNVYFSKVEGYECDDVISQIGFDLKELNKQVVIFSEDKDYWQLLPFGIEVSRQFDKGFINITDDIVLDTFGVISSKLLKFRALKGDTSDNLPSPVRLTDKFRNKFVEIWSETNSFNETLKSLYSLHKKECIKINENKLAIYNNLLIMDLQKYRNEINQFEYSIFKSSYKNGVGLVNMFDLKNYQKFLKENYNVN